MPLKQTMLRDPVHNINFIFKGDNKISFHIS